MVLERQALHAHRIEFDHPATGDRMKIEAPLPADIVATLEALKQFRS
jgi:23S rRNA pseudouridine1911/1915/1917 synthase